MSRWRLLFPLLLTSWVTAAAEESRPLDLPSAAVLEARPILGLDTADPCAGRDKSGVAAKWSDVERQRIVQKSGAWRLRWEEPTTAASRTQAVASETQTQAGGEVARVEFRSPSTPQAKTTTAQFRSSTTSKIRLTANQTLSDPLDDPFGARGVRNVEPLPTPPVSLQPPATEGPFELPPAGQPSEEPPFDPGPTPFDPAPEMQDERPFLPDPSNPFGLQPPADEPQTEPTPRERPPLDDGPSTDDPGSDAPAPPRSLGPLREPTESCQRVYNGRNCCTEDEACEAHRKRVGDTPIQMISLDITPLMTVTQLDSPHDQDYAEYERDLTDELRKAPARLWRNREGEEVADGRMTNFRRGRVEIQTEDEKVEIPFAELSRDDMCFVTAWWNIPSECVLEDGQFRERHWIATTFTWKASSLCHKPLYFQDVQLERYGHSAGPLVQPVLSGAHFFLNIAALPYTIAIQPPYECRYPLGYYRPGDCAPWLVPPVPLSVRGGLIAAGVYVGGVYLIP